jgi:hypothetical protein
MDLSIPRRNLLLTFRGYMIRHVSDEFITIQPCILVTMHETYAYHACYLNATWF